MGKRIYTTPSNEAFSAAAETMLADVGLTQEGVKRIAKRYVTNVPWFSKENLSRQKVRLENAKKKGLKLTDMLEIVGRIEKIENVLKGV